MLLSESAQPVASSAFQPDGVIVSNSRAWTVRSGGCTPAVTETGSRRLPRVYGMCSVWDTVLGLDAALGQEIAGKISPQTIVDFETVHLDRKLRDGSSIAEKRLPALLHRLDRLHVGLKPDVERCLGTRQAIRRRLRDDMLFVGSRCQYHTDDDWRSVYLVTFLYIDGKAQLRFPWLDAGVSVDVGTTVLFDGLQAHGLARGATSLPSVNFVAYSSSYELGLDDAARLKGSFVAGRWCKAKSDAIDSGVLSVDPKTGAPSRSS